MKPKRKRREKDTTKPRSGTIKCTWAECPNRECKSREWETWDIDFQNGDFWCGTCMTKLHKPIFGCPLQIKGDSHE